VCTLFYAIARPCTRQFDGSVHTERTRLATFTKLNSGSWRAQVRRKGKYVNETFLHRKDAEEWALEVERRINRGEPAIARTSRDAKTFGDLVKLHREDLQEVGKRIGRSKAASLTFLEHRLGRLRIPDLDRGRLIEFLWERRPGPAILKAIKLSWPFIAILFVTVLIKVDLVTKWEGVSSYPLIGAATGCMIVIVTTEEMTFL
jgi:hypothetical protein